MKKNDEPGALELIKASRTQPQQAAPDFLLRKGDVPGHEFHGNQYQAASARLDSLKGKTKKEVFDIWTRATLGRVHNANIAEQNKSWMIHDILRAEHGKAAAEAVDK